MGGVELLTAFSLRSLGDVLTVITVAKRSGITDIDALESIVHDAINLNVAKGNRRRNRIMRQSQKADRIPNIRCSVCGQYAKPLPVNDTAATMVGGTYQSCTVCHNPECKHVDYYDATVAELLRDAG